MKKFRLDSKAKSTREYPYNHLFRQFGLHDVGRFIGIPEVSSSRREYLPVAYFDEEVIISNKVYGAPDDGGLLFGIASSSMFMVWMKTVGGRLKSDVSFSSTLTWNNFPMPAIPETEQNKIAEAGEKILEARLHLSANSLAKLYNPDVMRPELRRAHDALDRVVDKAFGAPRKLTTEAQRLELLFKNFQDLIKKELK